MTSKEALEKIKNHAISDIDSIPLFAVDICKSINKELEEAYNIVLKDLEKLEVLKILTNNEVNIAMFNLAFIEFENDYNDYYCNFKEYSRYKMDEFEFNTLVKYLKKLEEEIDNDK